MSEKNPFPFNCDAPLWQNARDHYRQDGIELTVLEGHILIGAYVMARCEDQESAIKMLREAGYTPKAGSENVWLP